MVNKAKNNLKDTLVEIVDYLKKENILLFWEHPSFHKHYVEEITWSQPENWKEFINVAKGLDVKLLIIQVTKLEKKDLETLCTDSPEITSPFYLESLNHLREKIVHLKKDKEIIRSITLYWMHEAINYRLDMETEWYIELLELELIPQTEEPPITKTSEPSAVISYKDEVSKILKKFNDKTEAEIAEDIVKFAQEKNLGVFYFGMNHNFDRFWGEFSNHLSIFTDFTPEQTSKKKNAEKIAEEKLIPGIFELNHNDDSQMAKKMVDFLKDRYKKDEPKRLIEKARDYWISLNLNYHDQENEKRKCDIENLANVLLMDEQKELISNAIIGCIAWLKERNASKISKGQIELFCTEKGLRISRSSMDQIYAEIKRTYSEGKNSQN